MYTLADSSSCKCRWWRRRNRFKREMLSDVFNLFLHTYVCMRHENIAKLCLYSCALTEKKCDTTVSKGTGKMSRWGQELLCMNLFLKHLMTLKSRSVFTVGSTSINTLPWFFHKLLIIVLQRTYSHTNFSPESCRHQSLKRYTANPLPHNCYF